MKKLLVLWKILKCLFNYGVSAEKIEKLQLTISRVSLGGLGVTCSPRDPRFAGSNPAEIDGFFRT